MNNIMTFRKMAVSAIFLVFIGVTTTINLDWLHYFTLVTIYGLPVVFIACGLGAGTAFILSFSESELNIEAISLFVISVFIGVAMIKAFWGVYP